MRHLKKNTVNKAVVRIEVVEGQSQNIYHEIWKNKLTQTEMLFGKSSVWVPADYWPKKHMKKYFYNLHNTFLGVATSLGFVNLLKGFGK